MISSRPARRVVADVVGELSGFESIIDAGSGWGTLAFYLAGRFPGKRITGLENSTVPFWTSKFLKRIFAPPKLQFLQKDIYTYDYSKEDIIVCYLYPGAMHRFKELATSFKEGTVLISVCFAIAGWHPLKTIICKDMFRTKVYVYQYLKSG